MDATTPVGKLMSTLKQQVKAKGLNYRSVASCLNVSEATIKRYFSGKGVTIDILQRLAEVVDLDVLTLVILAKDQDVVQCNLNKAQQAALTRRSSTSMTFFKLVGGWTPAQVAREFDLADQMDAILARLQSLGLIRRLRGRVQILVRPDLERKGYGQLTEVAVEAAHEFLRSTNLREEKCEWMVGSARLSQASIVELRDMIKRFRKDVYTLSKRDLPLPRDQIQWYHLVTVARPTSVKDSWLRM